MAAKAVPERDYSVKVHAFILFPPFFFLSKEEFLQASVSCTALWLLPGKSSRATLPETESQKILKLSPGVGVGRRPHSNFDKRGSLRREKAFEREVSCAF
jgi:hypothetical protein